MGTIYVLMNKTKNESLYIDGIGHKYFELMCRRYSNFVLWLMLDKWKGDHVVFFDDKNSYDIDEEFYQAKDVTKEYWEEFEEFIKANSWYFYDVPDYNSRSSNEDSLNKGYEVNPK